ncbi:hypothetical protein [Mycobacterium sp. 236(2023)]|uniref:PASTA domain-containing protein n=1 Tax=Mycobacterium sp. 236(2023) TaxID=3038163 RepID=UPI00241556F9|nr:hypothetical protein [Mycobacterium sp. 236(2023)]MDG4663703.1 hypothetical protein [Mycobacterium sp. 236(2023)]
MSTLVLVACGSSEQASPATVTVTDTSTVAAPTPVQTPAPAPPAATVEQAAPPAAPASWTMPNLIGRDLQAAQDAIQALTNFEVSFSTSTDLTGQGRAQIMDRNWQVCSSSPSPGAALTTNTPVDFGVVRDSESCP